MVANGSAGAAGPSSWPAHLPFSLAKPGTMFIAQPDIPVPLAVDFPFPAWATRPSEKGEWAGHDTSPPRPSDPFAAIAAVDDEPPY